MGFDFLDFGFPKSGTDWKSINGKPYITVSSKGRSNGLSNKINDGADFGVDTTLGATSPNQTGPPYSYTYGVLEAINYSYGPNGTGQPIKLSTGRFIMSPNAPLTQINSSNIITGLSEYAILPIPTSVLNTDPIQTVIIHGSGGLPNPGGSGNKLIDYDSMTVIDVSNVSAPSGQVVVTMGWNRGNTSNNQLTNSIDIRDFVIAQATPVASGDNIVGGFDFEYSYNSYCDNVNIWTVNNPDFSTVFPANTEMGGIIDGYWGNLGYIGTISIFGSYYGLFLGDHEHCNEYVCQSNYYGLIGIEGSQSISQFDVQGTVYSIYEPDWVPMGETLLINLLRGEDYTSAGSNGTIDDILINPNTNGSKLILVQTFAMYTHSTSNYRVPILSIPSGYANNAIINNVTLPAVVTNGTTAGTVTTILKSIGNMFTEYLFSFNGYENDTTTNQTINFPAAFSTTPQITENTTGLTITASTTGITITAPDNTNTYSGIIKVTEGQAQIGQLNFPIATSNSIAAINLNQQALNFFQIGDSEHFIQASDGSSITDLGGTTLPSNTMEFVSPNFLWRYVSGNIITLTPSAFTLLFGVSTKGLGISPIYGLDNRTGITAADASAITLYTTTAAGQLYRVSSRIFATTGTSATYVITWTEGGAARTETLTVSAVDTEYSAVFLIQPDSGTAITAQITSITSSTVNVATVVERAA